MLAANHFPRVIALALGLALVRRCDATDISFDHVEMIPTDEPEAPPQYRVTLPAQAVPPLPDFDPATAEEWPSDAALADAIDNPAPYPAAPFTLSRLVFLERLTDAEKLAILTSTNPGVIIFRTMFLAANIIDSADERMGDGLAYLEGLGLIGEGRAAALLAP
jgi:hypothetical protein